MRTTGTVLGPKYGPHLVEMESTKQQCIKLTAPEAYAEFTVRSAANAMVVRYCLPDAVEGGGIDANLDLYCNGKLVRQIPVTSRYAWLYGEYPFTNDPKAGKPRNFYDEVRVKGLALAKGDIVRLKLHDAAAAYCIIDLVDLENIAPPRHQPLGSLAITAFGADPSGVADSTDAVRACIAAAARHDRLAWIPPGEYKLTGDIVLPSGVTLQGAGMWHTTFVGDETLYDRPDRRLRLKLVGSNSHLADFALLGKIKYRKDSEQNDGIFGDHARNCTVSHLWVEHTKVGMWFYVSCNVVIDGCRLRNTKADGINLCVDVRDSTIQNCTARGTGDDCFAIWPAASDQGFTQERSIPGNNVIRRCTGQTPFLAQGGSIYGGANNRIEDCLFADIGSGCGILISTTFPTSDKALKIDNNFSGTTVVRNCELVRCGGYDHGWTWRAALQVCLDRRSISGLLVSNVDIKDSLSNGIAVVVPGHVSGLRKLSDARFEHVTVSDFGIGAKGRHGLWVSAGAGGELAIVDSNIPDIVDGAPEFQVHAN